MEISFWRFGKGEKDEKIILDDGHIAFFGEPLDKGARFEWKNWNTLNGTEPKVKHSFYLEVNFKELDELIDHLTRFRSASKSKCCDAPMMVGGRDKWDGSEGSTHWLVCRKCLQPCDQKPDAPPSTKTLRDEFAMAAMQGILSSDKKDSNVGSLCYAIADAMLKERDKKE